MDFIQHMKFFSRRPIYLANKHVFANKNLYPKLEKFLINEINNYKNYKYAEESNFQALIHEILT